MSDAIVTTNQISEQFLAYVGLTRYNMIKFDKVTRHINSAIYLDASAAADDPFHRSYVETSQRDNSAFIERLLRKHALDYQIPGDSFICRQKPEYLGYALLHFVVIHGNAADLRYLLERGADFTLKSSNGLTPLRLAIKRSYGKDANCLNLKGTLKHLLVDAMLDAHVKTNNPTNPSCKNGISHFHIACMTNNVRVVEFFVANNGASVNEAVNADSDHVPGYSPLHFAARYCCVETVRTLLDLGAERHARDARGVTPLHLLAEYKMEIIESLRLKSLRSSSLLRADLRKIDAAIGLLTSDVADHLQPIDATGLTQLHLACIDATNQLSGGLLEKIRDVDPIVSPDSPVWPGYTPLHFAARCSVDAFVSLLKYGANVAAKDSRGATPLDVFLEHHNLADVRKVLSSEDSLRAVKLSDGADLMDAIVSMFAAESFESFLKSRTNGANIAVCADSPIWPGYTLLHLAVSFATSQVRKVTVCDICEKLDYVDLLVDDVETPSTEVRVDFDGILDLCLDHGVDFTVADANGTTALHLAAYLSNDRIVCKILERHGSRMANPVDSNDLSHFDIALYAENVELVEKFIRSGVVDLSRVKSRSVRGRSGKDMILLNTCSAPLHISVYRKNLELTGLLLRHGADPLMRNTDGLTPLHYAFSRLDKDQINLLLSDPRVTRENTITQGGLSNFFVACYVNNLDVVRSYLDSGADPNSPFVCAKSSSKSFKSSGKYSNCTALHVAILEEHFELAELLVTSGASLRSKNSGGLSALNLVLKKVFKKSSLEGVAVPEEIQRILDCLYAKLQLDGVRFKDELGITLLHVACLRLDANAIESLLESGADVNAQVNDDSPIFPKYTALHLVFSLHHSTDGIEPVVQLLLRHGADVTIKNDKNQTPVHVAYCAKQKGPVIAMLLQSQRTYDFNPTNNDGLSHFHIACSRNNAPVAERFLRQGADVNQRTHYYLHTEATYTPLHYAVTSKSREVFDLLLRHGADSTVRNKDETSLLHYAVGVYDGSDEALDILRTLLSINEVDINALNRYNAYPLYLLIMNMRNRESNQIAASTRDLEAVELLMSRGARVNIYVEYEGLLGKIFNSVYELYPEIFMAILNSATDLHSTDEESGFSAMHNIVLVHHEYQSLVNEFEFADVTGELLLRGCQLDHQEYSGKTALHTAIMYANYSAIAGLLSQGADVNVVDYKGKTPYDYCDVAYDRRRRAKDELTWHVHKMQLVGLEVSESNEALYRKLYPLMAAGSAREDWSDEACFEELERLRSVGIFQRFTLRDMLSEDVVLDYPTMSSLKRETIARFFRSNGALHREYAQFAGLLRLQHRRGRRRIELAEPARNVVNLISGYALPDYCVEVIMRNLSFDDLKTLGDVNRMVVGDDEE